MRTLPAELLNLIVVFQPLFTKPAWEHAIALLLGARNRPTNCLDSRENLIWRVESSLDTEIAEMHTLRTLSVGSLLRQRETKGLQSTPELACNSKTIEQHNYPTKTNLQVKFAGQIGVQKEFFRFSKFERS